MGQKTGLKSFILILLLVFSLYIALCFAGESRFSLSPHYGAALTIIKKGGLSTWAKPSILDSGFQVVQVMLGERQYLGKREKREFNQIAAFFHETFPKIAQDFKKSGSPKKFLPSGIFYNWDIQNKTADVAAAFLVEQKVIIKGWNAFSLPAGKALKLVYKGGYANFDKAYQALDAYQEKNKLVSEISIEEYHSDPFIEKDTSKWVTVIYRILK